MSLQLIIGPMFSGKTTELLRRIRRATIARELCIVLRWHNDNRYTQNELRGSTHDMELFQALSAKEINSKIDTLLKYDVVGIDEGQFYPDLVESVKILLLHQKTVIVSGLDGDFMQRSFGSLLQLVPICDTIDKLYAICALCHNNAPFTRRLDSSMQIEFVGGSESYIATCRTCLTKPLDKEELNNHHAALKRSTDLFRIE